MELIEIENWKRRDYFYSFMNGKSPLRDGTAILDCTRVYHRAQKAGIPFPVVMLHAILCTVNNTDAFRIRVISEDFVARYDTINLYTLELDRDHLLRTALTGYSPSLRTFYESYKKSRQEARRADAPHIPIQLNTINISYLPGIRFTQLSGRPAESGTSRRGCLCLSVGKMEYENGRATVPVAATFSHALVDGYDFGKGIEYFTDKYGTEELREE